MMKHQSRKSPFQRGVTYRALKLKKRSRQLTRGLSGFFGRNRKSPLYLSMLLGLFALVGAVLLATSHQATSQAIAQRLKEDLLGSLAMVIPEKLYDNDLVRDSYGFKLKSGDERIIYPAAKKGRLSALAYQVTGQGYGGSILVLIGIDSKGQVLGVRVLQHAETPGLGDKIEVARSKWVLGFNGLSLGNPPAEKWAVKKDGGRFDQFSGATITPRAVVLAVRKGLEFFEHNRLKLLNRQSEAGS